MFCDSRELNRTHERVALYQRILNTCNLEAEDEQYLRDKIREAEDKEKHLTQKFIGAL